MSDTKPWTRQTIAEMRAFAEAQTPPISLEGLTRKADIHAQIGRAMMLRDAQAPSDAVTPEVLDAVHEHADEPEVAQIDTQPPSERRDGRDVDAIMDAWRTGETIDADAENIVEQARERAGTAVVPHRLPSLDRWRQMNEMSADMATSAIVRAKKLNRSEDVLVVLLAAHDLGVSFTMALQQIHVIDGKPSMSGQMMIALVRSAGYSIMPLEMSDERAIAKGVRGAEELAVEFSIEDAIAAELVSRNGEGKLTGKDNWVHYPKSMLWWRAVAIVGRIMFPDVLGGLTYTPEELGANTDAEGNVIDVQSWDVTRQNGGDSTSTTDSPAPPDDGEMRMYPDCEAATDRDGHDDSGLCCLKVIQRRTHALPDTVRELLREEWAEARQKGELVEFRYLQEKHRDRVAAILHDAEGAAAQLAPTPPCETDVDALASLGATVVSETVVSPLLNADDPGGREITAAARAREIAADAAARNTRTAGECVVCGKAANSPKDPDYCTKCEPF